MKWTCIQLLASLRFDEYWWIICWLSLDTWSPGDEPAIHSLLRCGCRCAGNPKKCSLKDAHSPKFMARSFLRSSTSPKMSAEPLRLLLLTISMYLVANFILSNWKRREVGHDKHNRVVESSRDSTSHLNVKSALSFSTVTQEKCSKAFLEVIRAWSVPGVGTAACQTASQDAAAFVNKVRRPDDER